MAFSSLHLKSSDKGKWGRCKGFARRFGWSCYNVENSKCCLGSSLFIVRSSQHSINLSSCRSAQPIQKMFVGCWWWQIYSAVAVKCLCDTRNWKLYIKNSPNETKWARNSFDSSKELQRTKWDDDEGEWMVFSTNNKTTNIRSFFSSLFWQKGGRQRVTTLYFIINERITTSKYWMKITRSKNAFNVYQK